MELDVDTAAVEGVADAVRRAAGRVCAVTLPMAPRSDDVAVVDAVTMLLEVSGEHLRRLGHDLEAAAVLVETAAVDYARTEAALTGRAPPPGGRP